MGTVKIEFARFRFGETVFRIVSSLSKRMPSKRIASTYCSPPSNIAYALFHSTENTEDPRHVDEEDKWQQPPKPGRRLHAHSDKCPRDVLSATFQIKTQP